MTRRDYSDSELDAIGAGLNANEPIDKVLAGLPPRPSKRLKNNNEESRSQKMLIKWWSHRCKDFDIPEQLLFAIPNGMAFGGKEEWQRKTSAIRAKNAKLEGLRPGICDLMLAVPRFWRGANGLVCLPESDTNMIQARYYGLFIEMKTASGVVSPEQTMIISFLQARNYKAVICRSTEEAIREIENYLT